MSKPIILELIDDLIEVGMTDNIDFKVFLYLLGRAGKTIDIVRSLNFRVLMFFRVGSKVEKWVRVY